MLLIRISVDGKGQENAIKLTEAASKINVVNGGMIGDNIENKKQSKDKKP